MTHALPLGASLRGAAAFVPRALAQAPGALVLFAAALALPFYARTLGLGAWSCPLTAALAALTGLVAEGALYRLGVGGDARGARALGLGPLGIQLRAAELRLVAAAILVGLFLAAVLFALGVPLALAVNALGVSYNPQEWLSAPQGWRIEAMAGAGALAAWVVLQLAVRLSLYKAATVARRRIVGPSALGLSEHNFWRLLCGLVVTLLPTIALAVWLARGGGAGVWTGAVLGAVAGFVQAPLSIGFLSEAYRRLEYWR